MTSLVRRFLKTAIGFLVAGLLLGGWMIVQRELFLRAPSPYLVSAHTHALLVGFTMSMILGVALWMFPRPAKDDTWYRPRMAEAAYWFVTLGTAARTAAEVARSWSDAPALRWLVVFASLAQGAGLVIFFATMWTRIRPLGSHTREAAGERF